jgi:hypothetical protein
MAATTVAPPVTNKQIMDGLQQIQSSLKEKANQRTDLVNRGGGIIAYEQHSSHQWPNEKLKKMMDSYAPFVSETEISMLSSGGRKGMSGIGPYLCKMAGMAAQQVGHQPTLQVLRQQGLWDSPSYGTEQIMKQFPGTQLASAPYVTKGMNGRMVEKAALAESSGQTGGYTIPPQFMNELLTIAAEDGFIEQRAKVIPMNTRTAQWPMLDITTVQAKGTTPYFGGILAQWQPEAASISETEPAFKLSDWTAWDLVLYAVSSNQLLADNGIGLDALLTQLFGQAITWYKEYAYLQGLGAGGTMPLGVLNAPATLGQARLVANRFLMADAASMLSHLQIRSWNDACWVMHQSVIPEMILMVDGGAAIGAYGSGATTSYPGGNRLVWLPPMGVGDKGPMGIKMPQAFLNGLPLYFTEKLPQKGTPGDVVLVDWSRYVIGMRLDLQIDVSPHFLFRNNQLAWRVIARLDGKPWLNNFITDQSGFQVSPFVKLN